MSIGQSKNVHIYNDRRMLFNLFYFPKCKVMYTCLCLYYYKKKKLQNKNFPLDRYQKKKKNFPPPMYTTKTTPLF